MGASDLKPTLMGLGISMPILAILAVCLRFHARRVKKVELGVDDYLVVVALLFTIVVCAVSLAGVFLGNLGGHLVVTGPEMNPLNTTQFKAFSIVAWILQWTSIPAFGFTKLSTLFFYKRIFAVSPFKTIAWAMIVITLAWTVAFFFANLFDCIPFELNWQPYSGSEGKCINITQFTYAMMISDVLSDVFILLLPWHEIWKLHMPINRKLQVGFIFLLGWLVVGAGIARSILTLDNEDLKDLYYSAAFPVSWTIIESCVGVIGTCLPTLRPLLSHYSLTASGTNSLRQMFGRIRSSGSTQGSKTAGGLGHAGTGSAAALMNGPDVFRPPQHTPLVPPLPKHVQYAAVESKSYDGRSESNKAILPTHGITVEREFLFSDEKTVDHR